MSEAEHLIIAHAGGPAPQAAQGQPLPPLNLPQLARLLGRLAPVAAPVGAPAHLSMPHERALAQALGLPDEDGLLPLAAWDVASGQVPGVPPAEAAGGAWAWLAPCHWEVGRDHIRMDDPRALALSDEESRQALAAMAPFFEEDGVQVTWVSPLRWLARGEMLRALPCASLERVAAGAVDDWMPRSAQARTLRRLQQEMQMLLYTHPLNDARERRGQPTLNSFWVSGAGALPAHFSFDAARAPRLETGLADAATRGDVPAWQAAWQAIDREVLPALHQRLDAGLPVRLTLCGQQQARSWQAAPRGWWQRLTRSLRAPSVAAALDSL